MKRFIIPMLFLFAFVSCKAQSKGTVNLYGLKQAVLPGIIPGPITTDDGRVIEEEFKPKFNLFIYTASNNTITPVEVWLSGKRYSVKTESISKTPVEYTNPTSMPKPSVTTIVPKTNKKVLKLTLSDTEGKSSLKNTSLAKANELVVVYKQGSKVYYVALKSIKEIEPVAMQ
jgi:hypothetical protein